MCAPIAGQFAPNERFDVRHCVAGRTYDSLRLGLELKPMTIDASVPGAHCMTAHSVVPRGRFVLASMICLVPALRADAKDANAASSTFPPPLVRHFYVYNETNVPIKSSIEFVPLAAQTNVVQSATLDIAPGRQTMVCTTYRTAVMTSSTSADGKLRWSKVLLESQVPEYTHVVSISCDRIKPGCSGLPDLWPNATSRQFPD